MEQLPAVFSFRGGGVGLVVPTVLAREPSRKEPVYNRKIMFWEKRKKKKSFLACVDLVEGAARAVLPVES